jgi:Invasion associated locus B (IalB) protein
MMKMATKGNYVMRRWLQIMCAGLVAASSGAAVGATSEPESFGSFGDWEAYHYTSADSIVCYVYSTPKKSESPRKVKRDPIYFMITNWPGRKIKGQISTIIGYPFKEDSVVRLAIDAQSYDLYTNGDTAWADQPETEAQIVKALKTGGSLTVKGTSWKGTETTDTYSLSGLTAAMNKIDTSCK